MRCRRVWCLGRRRQRREIGLVVVMYSREVVGAMLLLLLLLLCLCLRW